MELLTDHLTRTEESLEETLSAGKMAQIKRKKEKKQNELLHRFVRRKNTVTIRVKSEEKTSKVSRAKISTI